MLDSISEFVCFTKKSAGCGTFVHIMLMDYEEHINGSTCLLQACVPRPHSGDGNIDITKER